jgi:hypothetical protein
MKQRKFIQQHPHHKCSLNPLQKIFFSHPSKVQLFTFFATPPIKTETKDCKLVGTKLPIANHLDQSLLLCLGNQRQGRKQAVRSLFIIYYALLLAGAQVCLLRPFLTALSKPST